MILTVDIGNTLIKLGAWDDESLVFVARMQTNLLKTVDEYAAELQGLIRLKGCNNAQFDGAIIASVVPALSPVLRKAVSIGIGTGRVYLISPGLKTGLNIRIDNPATLGSDMVCAAVSAISKYPMPCIIASLGTATAVFALDGQGAFLGGTVSAGVGISLEALARRTAQLPHISLEEPGAVIGTNTVDSIKSGAIYGTAAMLDGIIGRMKRQLGDDCTVVACGGLADYIVDYCEQKIRTDDNLVLDGLRLIYQKNAK